MGSVSCPGQLAGDADELVALDEVIRTSTKIPCRAPGAGCGADGMVEAFIVAAGMRATPTRMSLVAVRIYATRRISASDFVERHRTCE